MEKNSFLIFNEIIYDFYQCVSIGELCDRIFSRLKMLIPFSYASLLPAAPEGHADGIFFSEPYCFPESFRSAELKYIRHCQEDPLLWLIHGAEPTLVRESDLLPEESRLHSSLYSHCYQQYNIYDSLQYSSVYNQRFLGVLTLFRTRIDGLFTDEDMFFLRSIGQHLNPVLFQIRERENRRWGQISPDFSDWVLNYHLTVREAQLLPLLFSFRNTGEMAEELAISEYTVQKHLQNLYRKMNVTSRWEIVRLYQKQTYGD